MEQSFCIGHRPARADQRSHQQQNRRNSTDLKQTIMYLAFCDLSYSLNAFNFELPRAPDAVFSSSIPGGSVRAKTMKVARAQTLARHRQAGTPVPLTQTRGHHSSARFRRHFGQVRRSRPFYTTTSTQRNTI